MHLIAVTQIAHDTPGRDYYQRKRAEGHRDKEALRALKRRISDAVYQHLHADTQRYAPPTALSPGPNARAPTPTRKTP